MDIREEYKNALLCEGAIERKKQSVEKEIRRLENQIEKNKKRLGRGQKTKYYVGCGPEDIEQEIRRDTFVLNTLQSVKTKLDAGITDSFQYTRSEFFQLLAC